MDNFYNFYIININGSLNELNKINEKLINNNKEAYYFIWDNSLFYFFYSSLETGCFGCIKDRITSKMDLNDFRSFLNISKINLSETKEHINSYIDNVFIKLFFDYVNIFTVNTNNYLDMLKRKLFMFSCLSFESNVIDFLKMPACTTCGKFNNMKILKYYNNIDNIFDDIFNNEKK